MNRQQRHDSGALALADPAYQGQAYQRQDLRQRDIVNQAILVQESSNTMSAIEYLKSRDIHPDVIERVLLDPARRRAALSH
jgi:hypothetical protein